MSKTRTPDDKLARKDISLPIRLFSPLDPITLATKLKDEMEASKKRTGRQVFGSGTESKMHLIYASRKGTKSSFLPELNATMTAHREGTLIEGIIKQEFEPDNFLLMWNSFIGVFFIVGLLFWIFTAAPLMFSLIFTGIPFLMLVSVNLLMWNSKEQKPHKNIGGPQDIIDFLEKTVDARSA